MYVKYLAHCATIMIFSASPQPTDSNLSPSVLFLKRSLIKWVLLCLTNLCSKQAFALKSNHFLSSTKKPSLFLKSETFIYNYPLPGTSFIFTYPAKYQILEFTFPLAQEALPSHSCFYSFLLLSKTLFCIMCYCLPSLNDLHWSFYFHFLSHHPQSKCVVISTV